MTYEPVTLDHLLEHQTWALRIARQLVREEHEAEELVQRTWIAALRRPPSTARGARAWIRRVIQNLARERHRRAGTRLRHELASSDRDAASPDASETVSREEIRELLADRLLALQEPYRTTLTLRYYEDLSSTEIAERLGVPSGTVRWRLKVGLDQLREELDRRCHGDRQRWVSALVLLAPRAENAGEGPLSTELATATAAPASLSLVGAVGLAACALGFAWFAWRKGPAFTGGAQALATAASDAPDDPRTRLTPAATREPTPALDSPSTSGSAPSAAAGPGLLVRVVDETGAPRADATIAVVGRGFTDERARTDARGEARLRFEARDLGALGISAARGRLALVATADGQAASDFWHVSAPFERAEPVVLPLGGPAEPLRGRVVDEHGAPVAGALVAWYEQRAQGMRPSSGDFRGPSVLSARSEPDGSFLLAHSDRGTKTLLVLASGFALTTLDPGLAEWTEVVLRRGATLRGRILNGNGTPAAGLRVATEPLHKANEWTAALEAYDPVRRGFPEVTRTGADGSYVLANVTPGERILWAGAEEGTGVASATLRLEEGQEAEWNATLGESRRLALRLVDEQERPLEGWLAVLRRPGGSASWWLRRATSDAEGRVVVLDCPEDELYLDVLDQTGLGSTWLSRKLTAGGPEELLRIATKGRAQVLGTLVDHLGSPELAGKLTLIALKTAMKHELERDERGGFAQRLAPGKYALVFTGPGAAQLALFELAEGEEHELGLLTLPAPGTLRIEARALAAGGEGTPSYSLFALFDLHGKETSLEAGHGEITGEALLSILPGRYRVLLFAPGGGPPEPHELTLEPYAEVRLTR